MSDADLEQTTAAETPSEQTEPTGEQAANTGATLDTGAASSGAGQDEAPRVYDQAYVEKLRAEAAAARVKGNEKAQQAAEQAAQDAREALAKELGKALGLVKDDEAPKPEDVIAQLTAERDREAEERAAANKRLRDYQTREALRDAANSNGGDYTALTDSATLQKQLAEIDTTADDFVSQVDAAVKEAITRNPKLKAQAVVQASGIEHGGTVAAPPAGVDAFRKDRRESRGHNF